MERVDREKSRRIINPGMEIPQAAIVFTLDQMSEQLPVGMDVKGRDFLCCKPSTSTTEKVIRGGI
jgi:hypothetical protein